MIWIRIKLGVNQFFQKFKKTRVKAVYEDDLEALLKSLGIFGEIKNGTYKCEICEQAITIDNLEAIHKKNDNIHVVCSNPECLTKL